MDDSRTILIIIKRGNRKKVTRYYDAHSGMRPLRAILCVDDQRLAHRIEESLLARFVDQGARILHAYDGLEALKVLAGNPDVDLILLDINMPVLNGFAFLEQKARTTFANIPVVVLTNEGERREEAEHALSLGATRVLGKPFGYDELNACVESIYGGIMDERRRAERLPVTIPISLKNGTGITRDVSGLGVYFSAGFPFEKGEDVEFLLSIPEAINVRCRGKVVRVDYDREAMQYGIGVTIDDYDVDDADQSEGAKQPHIVLRELEKYHPDK
jgi:CheY-like chemotaxis protein